jgi:Glycosyltransferase family 87
MIAAFLISAVWFALSFRDSPLFPWIATLIGFSLVSSYPVWFLLDRANIEGVLWLVTLSGTVALLHRRPILAASFFAIAASMKVYPGILLLLFLVRRQYKALAIAILVAGCTIAASLYFIGPTIPAAYVKFGPAVTFVQENYIARYTNLEIGIDHCAFSVLKQILYFKYRSADAVAARLLKLELPYAIAAVAVFTAAFWFRLRHMPVTNQFIAYIGCAVLLPFLSYDYTLIHLHLAFAVFLLYIVRDLAEERAALPRWHLLSILFCFAIIFTPQTYLVLGIVAGIGGQVKALAIGALIILAMLKPMPSSRFGELS